MRWSSLHDPLSSLRFRHTGGACRTIRRDYVRIEVPRSSRAWKCIPGVNSRRVSWGSGSDAEDGRRSRRRSCAWWCARAWMEANQGQGKQVRRRRAEQFGEGNGVDFGAAGPQGRHRFERVAMVPGPAANLRASGDGLVTRRGRRGFRGRVPGRNAQSSTHCSAHGQQGQDRKHNQTDIPTRVHAHVLSISRPERRSLPGR